MVGIPYQEAVGCLLYLVQGTRPDLAFAVNDVSRFNNNFGNPHWKAVKRIMRYLYLKGTIDYKLKYSRDGNGMMVEYTDSDWASEVDNRKSCTGFLFKLLNGAITWSSKRQPTEALSSTEAEYMALSSGVQEAVWLNQFGHELDSNFQDVIPIYCDNKSAIKLTECDGLRQRSKHIDVRYHFVRDKIRDGLINISYISTDQMAADNLTKAVPKEKHTFCLKEMGLC